jgi:hypothetical protein
MAEVDRDAAIVLEVEVGGMRAKSAAQDKSSPIRPTGLAEYASPF